MNISRHAAIVIAVLTVVSTCRGQTDPLGQEARKQLHDAIAREWLHSGDFQGSWYSIEDWLGSQYVEVKGLLCTSIIREELTSADKLNGIEWRGVARFTCKASRTCQRDWHEWGPWYDGCGKFGGTLDYKVTKANGQWNIEYHGQAKWSKPRPDQLPGVKPDGPNTSAGQEATTKTTILQVPCAVIAPVGRDEKGFNGWRWSQSVNVDGQQVQVVYSSARGRFQTLVNGNHVFDTDANGPKRDDPAKTVAFRSLETDPLALEVRRTP